MDILNLLNPEAKTLLRSHSILTPRSAPETTEEELSEDHVVPLEMTKKPAKIAKDAAKFEMGVTIGTVRFPPFETNNEKIKEEHEKLHIFPKHGIAQYPRHIPYNSEKKTFQEKTGRDSFEVFQYTFTYRLNDRERDWVVMWDYNIGLVRITPFFKALGQTKTVPQRAISTSPGLMELCYSITGGSIAAQGYWMPFDAAKALAATFCWDIRYALTPIFGDGFPQQCTMPEDPVFRRFIVDPGIVQKCKDETASWVGFSAMQEKSNNESGSDDTTPRGLQKTQTTPKEKRLRRRSGRFYGDDKSDDYEDSHSDDTFSRTVRARKLHLARKYFSSNEVTSASASPSPWHSSAPTSPATRNCSPMKRVLEDAENDGDESSVASSCSKFTIEKRRKICEFGEHEMLAAKALLDLAQPRSS